MELFARIINETNHFDAIYWQGNDYIVSEIRTKLLLFILCLFITIYQLGMNYMNEFGVEIESWIRIRVNQPINVLYSYSGR